MSDGLSYRDAGVDLDVAERAKARLKSLVESTRDEHTLSELGAFGGLYAVPPGMASPVLVSSADGVGTKLKVAFAAGRHDTVGQCLVNHCVNDILVQGARPLFFLDYLATGDMDEVVVQEIVSGVATACKENQCALLGGETAEMPGFYETGEYDLAGFVVGVVERARVLDGSRIRDGDALVGLASSGLHTNGYTLARKIVFDVMGLTVDQKLPGTDRTVGDELLAIHRSYLTVLRDPLAGDLVHGVAHITGGGIPGNLPRVLPEGLGAVIDRDAWDVPYVFRTLQDAGRVATEEMDRVFNMGIGMIVVVDAGAAASVSAAAEARGVASWTIGSVESGEGVRYR
ncbi:MAG: phosphoribosylformylglycinamidine cyclo-ligase [Gemmatimonadota bacterium]|nr:phosphoribosylformylglycinamidine cyclo-ligase [Gemmatimonadota bacterium]MDH3424958.1 phosphoribosylformylglycinamidine cyclo-ligase [Gemmatimonadota bacterium]